MKFLYLIFSFLLSVHAFAQGLNVSDISFDGIGHSVVRVNFTASGSFFWLRTRYVAAPGSCTDGVTGTVQGSAYDNYNTGALHAGPGNTIVVGGLTPNTTYQVCPEISNDYISWSNGVGGTVTTLPKPTIHPAIPIAPVTFNTDYPSTAGYNNVTTAADCSNFMDLMNNAIDVQANTGTVINVPAGSVCVGPFNVYRKPTDVLQFNSAAVNSGDNTIFVSSHGLTEGQGIIFGTSYGCLPGSLTNLNGGSCFHNGPIIAGQLYYTHVVDANRFQIYSGGAFGSSGSSLCQLPDGGYGTEYFVRWPRPLKWIVIRTSTPDLQFTPEHVRTSPAWIPKMAIFQAPPWTMGGSVTGNTLMSIGNYDNNDMSMIANLRFVGIEFTYSDNQAAHTSGDPLPWYSLFATAPTDQNIVVDRCYFHGLGTPHRVYNAIRWDGMNVAIIDSYLDNFEYFHSAYAGLGLSKVN